MNFSDIELFYFLKFLIDYSEFMDIICNDKKYKQKLNSLIYNIKYDLFYNKHKIDDFKNFLILFNSIYC